MANLDELKAYKEKNGLSVSHMAEHFGVTTATMSRYLAGKIRIPRRVMLMLQLLEDR